MPSQVTPEIVGVLAEDFLPDSVVVTATVQGAGQQQFAQRFSPGLSTLR